MKKYAFQWSDLGDMEKGRPNLGCEAPVMIRSGEHYSDERAP